MHSTYWSLTVQFVSQALTFDVTASPHLCEIFRINDLSSIPHAHLFIPEMSDKLFSNQPEAAWEEEKGERN